MPSFVLSSQGQPYMNAVSAVADTTGAWLSVGDGLDVVTFEFVVDVGAGNVTGVAYVEHTAQMTGTLPTTAGTATRVLLPLGSLHTTLSTAALASAPNPSVGVTLTALVTGRFAIHLGQVPAGNIRAVFDFASGTGASPNTVTCYASGWGRGR